MVIPYFTYIAGNVTDIIYVIFWMCVFQVNRLSIKIPKLGLGWIYFLALWLDIVIY